MFNSRKFRDLLENVIPLQKAAGKIADRDINANNSLMLLLIYPFSSLGNKFSDRARENSLRGFTLVEVLVVLAIIASLAAVAIPGLLRVRLTANETTARAALKTFSTAAELYAAANAGLYPTSENALTTPPLPYLNESYCEQAMRGYSYKCSALNNTGYTVIALPLSSGGNTTYTMTTGGVLTP